MGYIELHHAFFGEQRCAYVRVVKFSLLGSGLECNSEQLLLVATSTCRRGLSWTVVKPLDAVGHVSRIVLVPSTEQQRCIRNASEML